jgi:hypothetical protein
MVHSNHQKADNKQQQQMQNEFCGKSKRPHKLTESTSNDEDTISFLINWSESSHSSPLSVFFLILWCSQSGIIQKKI